jgi:hypothetical protein
MRNFISRLLKFGQQQPVQPALPGRTISEIAQDLALPELNDLYGSKENQKIMAIDIDGHLETLSYKPNNHGSAFALCIDLDNVDVNPTIRIAFTEVAEGRFEIRSYTVQRDDKGLVVLPSEKSLPPIRRIQNELLQHLKAA